MAVVKKTVNINFFQNASTFCVEFTVKNTKIDSGNGDIAQNVASAITLPAGLIIQPMSSSVDQGVFDDTTAIWTIGSLLPCKTVTASLCFQISDDSKAPYTILIDTTSDPCTCLLEDVNVSYTVEGVTCTEIIDCISHGSYTNDTTAAAGSVPVGGVYYNTTNSKLHTRMT